MNKIFTKMIAGLVVCLGLTMSIGIQTASADNVSKFISGSNLVNTFRIDQAATSGHANDQEIVDIYYVYHNTGTVNAFVTLDESITSDVQFVGGSYRTRQNANDPVNGDTMYEQAGALKLRGVSSNQVTVGPDKKLSIIYQVKITKPIYDELVFGGKLIGRHDLPVLETKDFPASVKVVSYAKINNNGDISNPINKLFVQSFGDEAYFTDYFVNTGSHAAMGIRMKAISPEGFSLVSFKANDVVLTPDTNGVYTLPIIPAKGVISIKKVVKYERTNPPLYNPGSFVVIKTPIILQPFSIGRTMFALGESSISTSVDLFDYSIGIQILGYPDILTTKTITPGTVYASGDVVRYTIRARNDGNAFAPGFVRDVIPTELTGCTFSKIPDSFDGRVALWTGLVVSMEAQYPNQFFEVIATCKLKQDYPAGTIFTNTATFTLEGGLTETGSRPNIALATGLVAGYPSLGITKQSMSKPVLSGDSIIYTITVTNTGTSASTGFCVSDVLPTQFRLTSSTPAISPVSCGQGWTGDLAAGASRVYTLSGVLSGTYTLGTEFTNTASVIYTGLANTSITRTTTEKVVVGGAADMMIFKTFTGTEFGLAGSTGKYILEYKNMGSSVASGVIITDALPTGLVPSAYRWTTGSNASVAITPTSTSPLVFSLGDIQPGESGKVSFVVTLTATSTGTIINTGTVSTTSRDIDTTNNMSSVSTSLTQYPDLYVAKTILNNPPALSGAEVKYKVDFGNKGGTGATTPYIVDFWSTILRCDAPTYTSTTWNTRTTYTQVTQSRADGTIFTGMKIVFDKVNAGETGSIFMSCFLKTQPITGGFYRNNVEISTIDEEDEDIYTNNTGTALYTYTVSHGLTITKAGTPTRGTTDLSGSFVSYTVVVTNTGTLPLTNIVLTDVWPTGSLRFGGTLIDGGVKTESFDLAVGAMRTFTFTGNVLSRNITAFDNTAFAIYTITPGNTGRAESNRMTITPPTPVFSNGRLEGAEICDSNTVYTIAPQAGQTCVSPGIRRTTRVDNTAYMCIAGFTSADFTDTSKCRPATVTVQGVPEIIIPPVNNGTCSLNVSQRSTTNGTYIYDITLNLINNPSAAMIIDSINCQGSSTNPSISYNADPNTKTFTKTCTYSQSSSTYTILGNVRGMQGCEARVTPNIQPGFGVCGNGKIDAYESCDLGGLHADGSRYVAKAGTITNYLDTAMQYIAGSNVQNKTCTASCKIEGSPNAIPACRDTDSIISVMTGEYLPISWDIQVKPETSVASVGSCAGNDGKVIKDTMKCHFAVFGPKDETLDKANTNNNGFRMKGGIGKVGGAPGTMLVLPCDMKNTSFGTDRGGEKLFEKFADPSNKRFAQNRLGTYFAKVEEMIDLKGTAVWTPAVDKQYGEYKLSLEKVEYAYCMNGTAVAGNTYNRVCQYDFAITKPYAMQKGLSSLDLEGTTDLKGFFDIKGDRLYDTLKLGTFAEKNGTSANVETIKKLAGDIETTYSNLATKVERRVTKSIFGDIDVSKVPGKAIFVIKDAKDVVINVESLTNDLNKPVTIIASKATSVIIKGTTKTNVMLIARLATVKIRPTLGDTFDANDSSFRAICDNDGQKFKGVIIAASFDKVEQNFSKVTNDDLSRPRCNHGNLTVEGLLYGKNIGNLVDGRRSQLQHWFTVNGGGENPATVLAERRKEVYEGAALYIKNNPTLRTSLPPGAEEILRKANVTKQ